MANTRFACDYAKLGTSSCKKCKQKLAKGSLRLAKLVPNPFSEEADEMRQYYHAHCLFDTFTRARATTKKIEDTDDIEGYSALTDEDKKEINNLIHKSAETRKDGGGTKSPAKHLTQTKLPVSPSKPSGSSETPAASSTSGDSPVKAVDSSVQQPPIYLWDPKVSSVPEAVLEKDNAFRTYRKLCADIAAESSYTGKSKIMERFVRAGTSGEGFKGDLYLLVKLLLPQAVKRIYNIKDKQLMKLFAQLFHADKEEMLTDLEQGDAAETVRLFFESSKSSVRPSKTSQLSMQQVDEFLQQLTTVSREDEQQKALGKMAQLCTGNDLKMIVRLIKHDLRINAGPKPILEALDSNGYAAFQASRNLHDVLERVASNWRAHSTETSPGGGKLSMRKAVSVRANLLTPVLPMLAEACRSVQQALDKCPEGMFAEIKYDGERLQLHKNGHTFMYFSRSLKPVQPHKVQHLKDFIPKAFPTGNDLIIDSEVLLVDVKTGKPLPFGTLGVHKKAAFNDASVCLFVFDCLHINGENLMEKPLKHRRKVLEENMQEIKNHVMFSEKKFINNGKDLRAMMMEVFSEGLEGLVLKPLNSIYEPGKRHWLKVKKDYLEGGSMADSADLIVLGAYYGTGNKGGMMSVFLMGAYDPKSKLYCTVTKCGNGHDDKTLEKIQKELQVVKISKDYSKVPTWLNIHRSLTPDFVVKDPKAAPVWEITGAEFSESDTHTAGRVSIRFPRVTKIRDDKTWAEATDVPRLQELFRKSKERTDFELPVVSENGKPEKKKRKADKEDEREEVSVKKKSRSEENVDVPHGSSSLKSLFTGLVFVLDEEVLTDKDLHQRLYRYLVAYDADVVDITHKKDATHIVIKAKEGSERQLLKDSLIVVTDDWVMKCIAQGRLLSVD